VIVGLVHPGEMGRAVGQALVAAGHEVLWASEGRSEASRARGSKFFDAGTVAALASRCEVVVSVVPPHAAVEVAESFAAFAGVYVDMNAVSPATAERVGAIVRRFVDGGIVGGPPAPRLYLSGDEAALVASAFARSPIETELVASASATKCAYAAWTKGSAALLLAIRDFAAASGVDEALFAEWARSQPRLLELLPAAERSAARKGWRFVGEMEEIAAAFAAVGLPPGFHQAAAEVYRRDVTTPRSDGRP
jgi:3-hydroxyisobutyrate dehydrogenase-like beta-hydroxyacid dehydrogenase